LDLLLSNVLAQVLAPGGFKITAIPSETGKCVTKESLR